MYPASPIFRVETALFPAILLLEYPSPGQNFEIKLQNQRDGGGGGPYASMCRRSTFC